VTAGALIVVLAAVVAGWWAHDGASKPHETKAALVAPPSDPAETVTPPPPLPPGGVEIRNDSTGAVMLVTGSDPNAVLRAFCRHPQFKSTLVPGSLGSTTPPDPDLLLGSAVLMDGAGTQRQVILKRDRATHRWSIGDGTSAIALTDPAATAALPVR
jgi:hypothetical protein